MLKNLLESYGVSSHVIDRDMASLRENIERTPEVVVAESDVEVARGIAEIFHNHLVNSTTNELAIQDSDYDEFEADEDTPATVWPGWPTCPRCNERRQTACPICENAGNLFALAYVPAELQTRDLVDSLISAGFVRPDDESTEQAALETNVLLLCNICDEPFLPRFYRMCEHCGHEFPDGIVARDKTVSQPVSAALLFGVTLLVLYGLAMLYLFYT